MVIFNCILKAFKLIGFSRFSHGSEGNGKNKRGMETKGGCEKWPPSIHFILFESVHFVYVCEPTKGTRSAEMLHKIRSGKPV